MMKQHYHPDAQRLSLMSNDYRTTADIGSGNGNKMRASQSQQMSFNANAQRYYNSFHRDPDRPLGNENAAKKSSTIKQFIQLADPPLQQQQQTIPKKSTSSSLAFSKIGDLSSRTLASTSKTNNSNNRLPTSSSFNTGNYLIKFPSNPQPDSISVKSSALLLPPPPHQHQHTKPVTSVRTSLPPTSAGENFYDEIDIYENDVFGSRHHLRALYNDLVSRDQHHRPGPVNNELMTTSTTSAMSGSSASMLLVNASGRSRNSNSSNLLQQFSSKINCFRSSQRNKYNDGMMHTVPESSTASAAAQGHLCKMKTSMSSSRIIHAKSPLPPPVTSSQGSSRARSRSPPKTTHLYNPCVAAEQSPTSSSSSSSSALSNNSSFSRSSMATSSMKSSKSLKLRIKSPFKFGGSSSSHHHSKPGKQSVNSESATTSIKQQLSPSASSGYNSSQDPLDSHRSEQFNVNSQQEKQSAILSYCSINDDASAKSKFLDSLIQKKQQAQPRIGGSGHSPAAGSRLSQLMKTSFSTSNDLCSHFDRHDLSTPKPVKSCSYSLDENDNLVSPGSNKSISSSSSSSYSASSSRQMPSKMPTDPNYMYLSDADSSSLMDNNYQVNQQSLNQLSNSGCKVVELKTSPFPRVNTCFVAKIKPTDQRMAKVTTAMKPRMRTSASSGAIQGKCVELKIDYDEPIYENLNSFSANSKSRQAPSSSMNSFVAGGGHHHSMVTPKNYSVNDVLHSLKNLELSHHQHQQQQQQHHLTTIPIVFMNNRDDDDVDEEDNEYLSQVQNQQDEQPTMIIHSTDAAVAAAVAKNATMSPATSTSSFSMSSDSSNYQYSPKPRVGGGSTCSSKPSQDFDDDELCDEEVEFYLFNSTANGRESDQFSCSNGQLSAVGGGGGGQYYNSYTKQPIALWEQLV